jgi:apolipoprotein N-acyltransferase
MAKNIRPAFYPFLAAALWAIFEWSQTLTWAGVPWGRLALGQIVGSFTATAMTASLFGSYFISALIIAVASLLAQAMRLGLFKWRSIVAASLALGNLICGAILYALPQGDNIVTVAAVQGNISSRIGYYSHTNKEIWDIYEDYTRRAAAEGAKIVLWPESVFTSRFLSADKRLQADLAALASECGVTVVMGCFDYNDNGDILNALVAYHSSGNADSELYCKRHLVPFGEYMPWRSFFEVVFPPLTEIAMLSEDIIAGESAAVMKDGGVALGGVICFDSIYEEVALDSVRNGAELLVLPTNDSWFGDSRAIYMHNAQARLRAIENARSIVRAANTGTSSIIAPNGKMLADIPVNEGGYIVSDVPISTGMTLYTRIGNAFVLVCAAFVLSLGAVGFKKKIKC